MRLATRFIGIISTIILARLLIPADFGLVAMAMTIYGFIEVMSQFSFDVVLIQKQDAGRDYYDSAWTMSVIRGVVTALILYLGAAPLAGFFGDERIIGIIYVLCFVSIAVNAINIGIVDFRKKMTFGKEFQFNVTVKVTAFVITIITAFVLRSYWALVIGIAASTALQFILSYIMHPFRPRWSLVRWREIMSFSQWLVLNNMLVYANWRADTLIVGKILGPATLGVYTIAYEIASSASSELSAPIRRALLPGYAKLANDPDSLRKSFIDGFAMILMVVAPVAIGIGAVADPLVRVVLGDKWLEAIPLLQILALLGMIQISSGNIGPLILATGRARVVTMITAFSVSIGIPLAIFATSRWGVVGTAWALVSTNLATGVVWIVVGLRVSATPALSLLSATWRSLAAVLAMVLMVRFVAEHFFSVGGSANHVLALISQVIVGALTYILVHLLLWRICQLPDGAERHVYDLVASKLSRA